MLAPGHNPKLVSHWRGPDEVLERLREFVYWVWLLGCPMVVVLHCDRLASYWSVAECYNSVL